MKRLLIFLLLAASTATAQLKPGVPATTAASLTGGPITIDGGSNTAPAYSFTGDENTGFYRTGAESLGLTTAGTLRLTVSETAIVSTLPVSAALGLVGAPAYSFTGDLNTGIFSPSAENVSIVGAGVALLAADGSGTVNITLAAPLYGQDGTAGAPAITFGSDVNTGLYTVGADTLGLAVGGALEVRFRAAEVDFTGNALTSVGAITSTGTSSFGESGFGGQIGAADGAVGDPSIQWTSDDDATGTGFYRSAADAMSLANNGVLTVTFDASGNTDFQDGNIVTTGTLGAGATTLSGNLAMGANDITGFDRIQATDASSTLLSAAGVLSYTQMYHSLTADAAQTLDSLVTINGGTAGAFIVLRAADTDDIFVDVGGGNIRGTDRLLDDVSDAYMAIFDGTNWLEVSFSDQGGGVIYTGAVTAGALSAAAGTFTGVVNVPDGAVGAPSVASTSDADGTGTGLYWSAADALSIANNGVLTVTFDASGNTDFQDGNIVTTGTFGSGAITASGASSFTGTEVNIDGFVNIGTGATFDVSVAGDLGLHGTTPLLMFDETDGAVDNQVWNFHAEAGQFVARVVNDANSIATNWLVVDRTGTTVDDVDFPFGTLSKGGTQFMDASRNMSNIGTIGSGAITSTGTSSFGESSFSGTVNVSDGTAGSPSVQFTSADDGTGMGMFLVNSSALGFSVNGNLELELSITQLDLFTNNIVGVGTIASGAITSSGNSNFGNLLVDKLGTPISTTVPDIQLADNAAQIWWDETDGAVDTRIWEIQAEAGGLQFRIIDDAYTVTNEYMRVDRTTTVVDSVAFPGSTVVFSAGTVGNPVIQFSDDNDGTGTGFYRSAADALSLTNNGVLTVTFDASGNTDFQDGNIVTTGTLGAGATTLSGALAMGANNITNAGTIASTGVTSTGDNNFDVLVLANQTTLTIASDAVTSVRSYHIIDTEASAALDTLSTINGGVLGEMLTIRTFTAARDVFLDEGAGNLFMEGDFTLTDTADTITFLSTGGSWVELARSNND